LACWGRGHNGNRGKDLGCWSRRRSSDDAGGIGLCIGGSLWGRGGC
jgi:hypothetical protein